MDPSTVPNFAELPAVEGMPPGCAWHIFDRPNQHPDVHGTLNFTSPSTILSASKEIRTGTSISLNWPLSANPLPIPRRRPSHTIFTLTEVGYKGHIGWDDEVHFNTQFSSQWDSPCHYPHQASGRCYNGREVTREGLASGEGLPTCEKWLERGGIVGRGVLCDWYGYWKENGQADGKGPLDGHRIKVEEIETILASQGTELRQGDVLIVRTGFTEVLSSLSDESKTELARGTFTGVHGARETARWLWDHRIAAVAGDAIAFEAVPALESGGEGPGVAEEDEGLPLHQWLLGMFGMPIGELWDLSRLAEVCRREGRWSFWFSSVPLNVEGLVGSPPNAVAVL